MHSQVKKPVRAIPSTIIIIPAMNMIVAQFTPLFMDASTFFAYQKLEAVIELRLSEVHTASMLCMQRPNTMIRVAAAPVRVI